MRNKRNNILGFISLLLFSSLTINSSDFFQIFNFWGTAFSETLTQQFLQAAQKDQCDDALGMLNDPSTLSKIDINARDRDGNTPLIWASIRGHEHVVEKLLSLKKTDGSLLVDIYKKGKDFPTDNNDDKTALDWAFEKKHTRVVETFLTQFLALRSLSDNNSKQLLKAALFCAESAEFDALVVPKVEHIKDGIGNTLLMHACTQGNLDVVTKLLALRNANGPLLVDINAKNKNGGTALRKAIFGQSTPIIKKLLIAGADASKWMRMLYRLDFPIGDSKDKLRRKSILDAFQGRASKLLDEQVQILLVFDALRRDCTVDTDLERQTIDAYSKFVQGKHDDLRKILFDHDLNTSRTILMSKIFNRESIKPLLFFLEEKDFKI